MIVVNLVFALNVNVAPVTNGCQLSSLTDFQQAISQP